jgi:hypothetical protein
VTDPYVDPATGVLRNRLGITDAAVLARAEGLVAFQAEIGDRPGRSFGVPVGNPDGARSVSAVPVGPVRRCWKRPPAGAGALVSGPGSASQSACRCTSGAPAWVCRVIGLDPGPSSRSSRTCARSRVE